MREEAVVHLAGTGGAERHRGGTQVDEALQRLADPGIVALDLRQHLLQHLLVQRVLPRDAQCLGLCNVLVDLGQDAEREGGDVGDHVPDVQHRGGKGLAIKLRGQQIARAVQLEHLRAVVDLVGEGVRGLVDVDRADERQIGRQRHTPHAARRRA
ncbi:hypothetical protein FBZ82_10176 [Azospirillum brasilense]|uniref:Uncharacterized protein n=1 Tax=Azospirillum brasilense TaxID=192 RepID=A0A560BN70_AZOBR|nr:hypothetical protein FBZ82_10176 [Azospirillum brasilense]